MIKPILRPILQTDKDQWLLLWNQYLQFYKQTLSNEVTEQTWDRFFASGYHKCLVAIDESTARVVGFVTFLFHPSTWTAAGYCYLEDLFVDPSSRGNGTGRQLIEAVVEHARKESCSRVYWHTDEANTVAQGLYEKVAKQSGMIQYRIQVP